MWVILTPVVKKASFNSIRQTQSLLYTLYIVKGNWAKRNEVKCVHESNRKMSVAVTEPGKQVSRNPRGNVWVTVWDWKEGEKVGDHVLLSKAWVGNQIKWEAKWKREGRGRMDDSLATKVRRERKRQGNEWNVRLWFLSYETAAGRAIHLPPSLSFPSFSSVSHLQC